MEAALELARQTGVLLRREALQLGMDDRALTYATRHGILRRMRHGMYTLPELWDDKYADERHRLLCEGVHRRFGDKIAFTHTSALVLQGIDVWGADLSQIHVTRVDGGVGRTEHGIVHHRGLLPDEDRMLINTKLSVVPSRAVMEHVCLTGVESGLVSADSALHQDLTNPDELWDRFERMKFWPRRQSGHIVLRLADGRSESPGETRSRYFCFRHHLPAPELQFVICDEQGNVIARVDFVWHEDLLVGEFDGRAKYSRFLKPGQDATDAVLAEKAREDAIREATGYRVMRWTWGDLAQPNALFSRFQRAFGARAA